MLCRRGVCPAELTWKSGVDVMSFGATKNGGMLLEAVVFFDTKFAEDFSTAACAAASWFPKGRYFGAQMLAYLENDLWLENAKLANGLAAQLAEGLGKFKKIRIPNPVQANEVFAVMPRALNDKLLGSPAQNSMTGCLTALGKAIADDEIFVRFVLVLRNSRSRCPEIPGT